MNIFYLHKDPIQAAEWHCDKHVCKMIIESAQMLSIVTRQKNIDLGYNMSTTGAFSKHPQTIWVGKSGQHFEWLVWLGIALCRQYKYRYDKVHKTSKLMTDFFMLLDDDFYLKFEEQGFMDPPQCMPDEYKVENDTVAAYRNYYIQDKYRFAKWHKGYDKAPPWWPEDKKVLNVTKK